jgi:hypothetical protein
MARTIETALEYNKGALKAVWSQLSGATLPSSPRNDLVWAYLLVSISHHEAIHRLCSQKLIASAFALLRSQIESVFRGLWVNLIATDEQVEAIRERGEEPFVKFRQVASDLDTAYGAAGWLQSFADHWGTLNGYTHTGLEQLGRQFMDDGTLAPNYPEEFILGLLVTSGTASIGCTVPVFRHVGLEEKAAALEQWLAEHPLYRKDDTTSS